MNARRTAALALASVTAWSALPAAAARRPREGAALRVPGAATVAPQGAWTRAEVGAAATTHDTLYRTDPDGRPTPHLAAALPVPAEDGLTVRIPIAPGLVFHDGRPIGAEAAAASLERVRVDRASPHSWLLAHVTAVAADGSDVVLTLRRPLPDLAARLAAVPTAIVRPRGKRDPIGCGPFRGAAHQLAPFGRHVDGAPYAGRLELRTTGDPREEALQLQLGRLHVSRVAPDDPTVPVRTVDGPWEVGVVLLVRPRVAALASRIGRLASRARLVRFSPTPARVIAHTSPPAAQPAPWPEAPLRLLVRDAPHLRSMAEAVMLSLTAEGARVAVVPLPTRELVSAVTAQEGDLVLVERPPVVVGEALVAAQLAALAGGGDALPLLSEAPRLFVRREAHGVRFDPAGFPRYEDAWAEGP